jgi:hypothetical protein
MLSSALRATKQPAAGKALFYFLTAPDTIKVMKAKGLDPAS